MTSRRAFLTGLLASGLVPSPSWADAGDPSYLSAAKTPEGAYVLVGLDDVGAECFRIPLPDRGHAATAHPHLPHAVAFARRPGRFAVVVDCRNGATLAQLNSPDGRHFYGHGTFDAVGELLFTTENDYKNGVGRIGIWDARQGYLRVGEIASNGIGPHDLRSMPDGTLVVANGGIDTHPETGRQKLNLDTMRPNLSYLNSDGVVLDQIGPIQSHASIRHLAVREDGLVAVGMQWQGDNSNSPALVGLHQRGETLLTFGNGTDLNGYVGSIAFSTSGELVAATSPRNGQLTVFSAKDGAVLQSFAEPDICGVAGLADGFLATTGKGKVLGTGMSPYSLTKSIVAWDNHLVSLVR